MISSYIYCSYKRNELYEGKMLFLYLALFVFSIYPKRYFIQLYIHCRDTVESEMSESYVTGNIDVQKFILGKVLI